MDLWSWRSVWTEECCKCANTRKSVETQIDQKPPNLAGLKLLFGSGGNAVIIAWLDWLSIPVDFAAAPPIDFILVPFWVYICGQWSGRKCRHECHDHKYGEGSMTQDFCL